MSTASDPKHLDSLDPNALLQIKNLQLRARLLVDGLQSGSHRSPQQGFSVEFDEYRPYSIGDDPRSLDWKLYARTDRYCIKKYRDETNRRCYILLDCSRSMDTGSLAYTKLQYAQTLAATLAHYFWSKRDAVGFVSFDSKIGEVITAKRRNGQLQRIIGAIETQAGGDSTRLDLPLTQLAQTITTRGLVIIISDFLTPIEDLVLPTSLLAARGQEVCSLRILDPNELKFQPNGALTLRDAETGKLMYIDPAAASRQYAERFAAHANSLEQLCSQYGGELLTWTTDQKLSDLLRLWVANNSRHVRRGTLRRRIV